MKTVIIFLATYLVALILDLLWLRLIACTIYLDTIGSLLRKKGLEPASHIPSALLVYAIMSMGIIYLALPNIGENYTQAFFNGALLGAFVQGIYNASNYAMLENWPLKIALIDFTWGVFLYAISTLFALFISQLI